ncbi:hypothetical protein HAX54_010693 [Datura stramonium]|uniref:IBB domain-containing protein n=1 Tax=Datura stramonium TaxID=4076 RepID=A0ABS8TGN9_DATST|nr:hypothetical protein [Datura stramonium]
MLTVETDVVFTSNPEILSSSFFGGEYSDSGRTQGTEVRRNFGSKVAVDAEEGRRRREDNMVEIRKNKREENLQKKRREGLQANQQFTVPVQTSVEKKRQMETSHQFPFAVLTYPNWRIYQQWLSCLDGRWQIYSLKLLPVSKLPIERAPIEEVIQAGVVPRFVQFLMRDDFPQLPGIYRDWDFLPLKFPTELKSSLSALPFYFNDFSLRQHGLSQILLRDI